MKKLLVSIVTASLTLTLALPSGLLAWADDSEEVIEGITEEATGEICVPLTNDDELDALLPYEIDGPDKSLKNNEAVVAENASVEPQAVAVDAGVEVTPGWNVFGTCEWLIDDAGCLTIRPANNGAEGSFPLIEDVEFSAGSYFPWAGYGHDWKPTEIAARVKTAKLEGDITASNSLERMFCGCENLVNVQGLGNLKAGTVTSLYGMFYWCESLSDIDMQGFNAPKATGLSWMFRNCVSLKSIHLSGWNLSSAENLTGMFYSCSALEEIDFGESHLRNLKELSFTFFGCSSLRSLDLSSFETGNVGRMHHLFSECESLTDLNISSFDTSNVRDMRGMFGFCSSLASIDVSHFDTSKVKRMCGRYIDPDYYFAQGMFEGCSSLVELNLSSFNTSHNLLFSQMFKDCSSLRSLDLSNFDTSNALEMYGMFEGCSSLTNLNLHGFDTSKVDTEQYDYNDPEVWGKEDGSSNEYPYTTYGMNGMFKGCSSLKALDLSSFDTATVLYADNVFDDALCEVTVGEKFTLQGKFPQVMWANTKGQQFYPEDIPVGVADTYTSTAPHVSIKVPEGASTALEVGNELQLGAEVFPSALASSLVWSSSDDGVASVDGAGKVTAKAAGTATITVKAGDLSDFVTVTVKAAGAPEVAVESVTLDKTSMTLVGQEMRTLSATVLPANATYKNVVWSSSDESVARVSAQGSVMAVGKGSATITVRSSDGKKSATCAVEVSNPVTWAGFSSVPIKVCVSKDYGIKVSARGDLPGETDGFTSVAWSSSDSAIAKVTGSGTEGSVKGVAPGPCTIHVSAVRDGKTFGLAEQIEVEWDLIESITLSEASESIQVGASGFTLEYRISNSSAAGRLGEIRWSASSIADIQGGNGVLTITPKCTGHEVVALWGPGVSAQFDLTVTPKVVSVSDDSDVEGVLHVNDSETAARVGDAHLRIKNSAEKTNHDLIQLAVGSAGGISAMLDAYDIDLVDEEGVVVPLEGASDAVTVFAKMGDPVKAVASTHDLGVHYIDAMNGKAEAKDTWVDGEMIAFETTHFSTYAITATQRPAESVSDPVKNDAAVESALAQTGDAMGRVLDGAACAALLGLVSLTILSALRRRWGMH